MSKLIPGVVMLIAAMLSQASAQTTAVDWSAAQTVNVLLVDNRFVPDRLSFQHGTPYRLHLENRGKEMHEFTAPEFFAQSVVREPGVLANGGTEIVVQPGMMIDVEIMPVKPGHYPLSCADHDWDGMTGQIAVE